jgi:hypothetical protein
MFAEPMEPLYQRQVFERLRETLEVGWLNETTITRVEDEFIQPNYKIRRSGVWLRRNDVLDALDWTPACELSGEGAPDPLSTPALPFPFTASQLAAFMVAGWGLFLGERHGLLDDDFEPQFLNGVRDAKPREALTAARRCLELARRELGTLDVALIEAQQRTRTATTGEARETGRKIEATLERDWRKALVQHLLQDRGVNPRTDARNEGVSRPALAAPSRGSVIDRQRRRLEQFRRYGGSYKQEGGLWHCNGARGALARLVREEQTAKRPMSDKKNVRADLIAALEAERHAANLAIRSGDAPGS